MSFKFLVCPARHNVTFNVTIEKECLHSALVELRKALNCTDLSYFLYNDSSQLSGLLKRNNKVVFFVSFAEDN